MNNDTLSPYEDKLVEILDFMADLAALKFNPPIQTTGTNLLIDALIVGFNMLSEEMEHSVVFRSTLEKSEGEFRSLFEQKQVGVAFLDLNANIIKCNTCFLEFYGRKMHETVGLNISELLLPLEDDQFEPLLKSYLQGNIEQITTMHKVIKANDTINWYLVHCSAVRNKFGRVEYHIALFQDITEIKKLQIALINASKMSALGQMASGIAHEVKNPLTIITGKASLLLTKIVKGHLDESLLKRDLEKIIETSQRIEKIINGLRSYSRQSDKDAFQKTPLKQIIGNVLGLCSERFKAHQIHFKVSSVPEVSLNCRSVQIEQILLNILGNAHDAILDLPEKWIHIDFQADNSMLAILISDSGHGIPEDVRDKIMEPFFTTKAIGKGTGLGLSISKNLIEEHHGSLQYNQMSPHTQFVVKLPVATG